MFSSLSTMQSSPKPEYGLLVSNYYGLPTPTYYIPFRDNNFTNYGSENTTAITSTNNPSIVTVAPVSQSSQGIRLVASSSQYLTLPSRSMTSTTSFSVSVWVNVVSGQSGVCNIWCISNQQRPTTDTTTNKYTWALFYSSNAIRFEYARDGSAGLVRRGKQQAVNTNEWIHIVCIQRVTSYGIDLYINGTKSGASITGTNNGTTSAYNFNWTSSAHQIGKSSYNADPYFSGDIDDFRFYANVELTDAEVSNLYAGRNAPHDFIQ
jgi:hypothetical protein